METETGFIINCDQCDFTVHIPGLIDISKGEKINNYAQKLHQANKKCTGILYIKQEDKS